MGKYLYQAIVTDLGLTPLHVWRFYNDRAEAELVIRELKEAYALGKIPSRRWEVNEAYFQLVIFAYNLLNWFRRLCVPRELQHWSLRTVRNQLLLVPAELVRPQGSRPSNCRKASPIRRRSGPRSSPSTGYGYQGGIIEDPTKFRSCTGPSSLVQAQTTIEDWRRNYNTVAPQPGRFS